MKITGTRLVEKFFFLLIALFVILAMATVMSGCANGVGDEEDAGKVKAVFDEYTATVVDGDIESWISLWAEDGRRMVPNAPSRDIHLLDDTHGWGRRDRG